MSTAISNDLAAIGLNFDKWQDAVEAAIATDRLAVTGEVRGGHAAGVGAGGEVGL